MTFDFFSRTQLKALSWWSDASPCRELDAVICDGAVRSGKTLSPEILFCPVRTFEREDTERPTRPFRPIRQRRELSSARH